MATAVKLGPADHGREMTWDEYISGDYEEGYLCELIDGRLYVSPMPNVPEDVVEKWILFSLWAYSKDRPDVVNYVTNKARVFVPVRHRPTAPEPDLAVYHDFPLDAPIQSIRWQDQKPILVGEVLSADDPKKDFVRNVELYLQVPTIKEYWVIDSREVPERPVMIVYRRIGKRWRSPLTVNPGETYATKLLPGFSLLVDPRR